MSTPDRRDLRYCWKCRSYYAQDAKICVRCGIRLETGESLIPEPEPPPLDEMYSDRLFYWRVTPARIASLVVWACYVALGAWVFIRTGQTDHRPLLVPIVMMFPVALIWFADSFVGMSVVRAGGVMKFPDRPALVAFCGWAMLVGLPAFFAVLGLLLWWRRGEPG